MREGRSQRTLLTESQVRQLFQQPFVSDLLGLQQYVEPKREESDFVLGGTLTILEPPATYQLRVEVKGLFGGRSTLGKNPRLHAKIREAIRQILELIRDEARDREVMTLEADFVLDNEESLNLLDVRCRTQAREYAATLPPVKTAAMIVDQASVIHSVSLRKRLASEMRKRQLRKCASASSAISLCPKKSALSVKKLGTLRRLIRERSEILARPPAKGYYYSTTQRDRSAIYESGKQKSMAAIREAGKSVVANPGRRLVIYIPNARHAQGGLLEEGPRVLPRPEDRGLAQMLRLSHIVRSRSELEGRSLRPVRRKCEFKKQQQQQRSLDEIPAEKRMLMRMRCEIKFKGRFDTQTAAELGRILDNC